jgi:hypothetical protein
VSFLNKLFSRKRVDPPARVRVCLECGMPLDQHRSWCAIFRTQQEMLLRQKSEIRSQKSDVRDPEPSV